jgi:aspartate/methionine/tyrosine aminotransferase
VASQPDAPKFSIAKLASTEELNLLSMVPDGEQRSVLYRELLRKYNADDVWHLSVAENVLNEDDLNTIFRDLDIPSSSFIRYTMPSYGANELLETLASKLNKWFDPASETINSDDVFVTTGVSSALELIALGLQTPLPGDKDSPVPLGSTVMLPVPFWQGFNWSFKEVPKLKILPVLLEDKTNFQLAQSDLETAYNNAADPKPKLLALTNPHNPLGMKEKLEGIYTWALSKDMHIISDEMYRHSQLKNAKPNFVSAVALEATKTKPEQVHVVWGFTKDFGLSGCRIGIIISKSKYVKGVMQDSIDKREQYRSLAWFSPFDSLKQYYVNKMLTPEVGGGDFWDITMDNYSSKLTDSFEAVKDALGRNNIKFVYNQGANSAQFFWLNLYEFLDKVPPLSCPESVLFSSYWSPSNDSPSLTREENLACYILSNAKVGLLSGEIMGCPQDSDPKKQEFEGYFRLCFTAYNSKYVVQAVNQLGDCLKSLK